MTARPVQAVFFWRADMTSVFKATYGRSPDGTSYTKDFHQPRGEMARALERALGLPEGGTGAVEWRWPGGKDTRGRLHPAADFADQNGRMNLRWQTEKGAPPPWRLIPSPTSTTLSTLRGTPGLTSESAANTQRDALIASGERPWLIAVHLHGEGPVLHARVVLENPQPGRDFASWSTLPRKVRVAMRNLPDNKPGHYVEFQEGSMARATAIVDRVMRALKDNPNVLLVGPPGTGKTVALEDVRQLFATGTSVTFDPDVLHGAFKEGPGGDPALTRVKSVVFHPSYAYEDFVIGLLPEPVKEGIGVAPRVGPLLDLARFASVKGRRALLMCDEFNRGAAASIFGDMLALLDADKREDPAQPGSGAEVETPYAHLSPKTVDGDVLPPRLSLPRNLFIIAAMNSADRSVAPLDAALRRRFSIVYVEPDYDVLLDHLGVPTDYALGEPADWADDELAIKALAVEVLRGLNSRIEAVSGRDFLLGQSLMWHVDGADRKSALASLAAAMDDRVLGTLSLTYTDNEAALAAVLNVASADQAGTVGAAASWQQPTERIREVASARLRVVTFRELPDDQLMQVLHNLR